LPTHRLVLEPKTKYKIPKKERERERRRRRRLHWPVPWSRNS